MSVDVIWNLALTAAIAIVGWFANNFWSELHRVQILLNKTREEMAKEYVTKADVHTDINRVIHRLDNLDSKLERYFEQKWEGQDRRKHYSE